MKIISYKFLGNGRYKVKFDNEEHIIYEDVILKHSILTKNEISQKQLDTYIKDNMYYQAYYKAISYINRKLRSKKEVRKYLSSDYSKAIIDEVIDRLSDDGYLNEEIYTSAYINDQINLKLSGPLKIKNELLDLGITETIIDNGLNVYTKEMQHNKITKYITKEISLNKNKSIAMIKNKILNSLIQKGFYKDDILDILNTFDIDDSKIYEKEYQKLYNKYSLKYNGKELEYKIKEKLYQKGFRN